jgi:2-C-methyl-D-erythritol 4-phosphate cytidylyltransferase/2-C-methyl-D-erythritol 2,4-cyclodiphosphate synthase
MSKSSLKQAQNIHLMIVAAGSGSRIGDTLPKQYHKIAGKIVLEHTSNKFININNLYSFLHVINPEDQDLYHEAFPEGSNFKSTAGSKTRKQSVYNGLKYFSKVNSEDIIVIHDAARPLVHPEDVQNVIDAAIKHGAATLASPVKDTLYREDETIDRDGLWSIQTPQAFHYGALMEAHEKYKDDKGFTDDAGLIRAMGHHVEIVRAQHPNIKITTPDDFAIVKAMIETSFETRTASGFDVHAFEKEPSDRKLILGGVHIQHNLALTGHSDADVILHAITDAVLGTINEGDIGTHFPPSDPQWKDADSAQFLKHTQKLLHEKNGYIQFIDVTLMAEMPKIGPHREAIQNSIAGILEISSSRVSIKATTTEKLGFTGRKEGIACQALVTVQLPAEENNND